MARPKGDPHQLKARIEAALEVAKPRDIQPAEVMAEILGMTWRNLLETYIRNDPAFPIKTRGSQGRGYEFQVVKVLKYLLRQCERRIAELDRAAREVARLTGVDLPPPSEGGPVSIAEMRATVALMAETQKLKIEQGELVPRALVDTFLRGYNDTVVQRILGEAVRIDPTGSLPVEVRAAVDETLRDIVLAVQKDLGAFIESLNGDSPPQSGGTVRRAAGAGRR